MIPVFGGGGRFAEVGQWLTDYTLLLKKYRLPMIAYEGGQNYVGGDDTGATGTFTAANRDPRMGVAYLDYMLQWKKNGGGVFAIYDDVGGHSKYGSWGLVESLIQLTDPNAPAAPKWEAVQTFIKNNPCWWAGCSRPVSASILH